MKIFHVINSFEDGGAEAVLRQLVEADIDNTHVIVPLVPVGKHMQGAHEAGVRIIQCGKISGIGLPAFILRLTMLIRKEAPSCVQTWMYHSDLIGGLAAKIASVPVYWGLHNSTITFRNSGIKRATIMIARINAVFSRFLPNAVVSVSQRGADAHIAAGYSASKMLVVPNGYDVSRFKPDAASGRKVREELSIGCANFVIGLVARFDPLKDHANLFAALALVKMQGLKFTVLLAGGGIVQENREIMQLVSTYELTEEVKLLGPRNQIQDVFNAMDMHVLSSTSEAFPNVLCEAMACGIPCVSTDVGDAGLIIGDTGIVVSPKNPGALATGIQTQSRKLRDPKAVAEISRRCRSRIVKEFSVETMVKSYSAVWAGQKTGIKN